MSQSYFFLSRIVFSIQCLSIDFNSYEIRKDGIESKCQFLLFTSCDDLIVSFDDFRCTFCKDNISQCDFIQSFCICKITITFMTLPVGNYPT